MGITLSIDNLTAKDSLTCEPFEIRRAYVILSRDGVVTARTLSESQNEILKESVEFFEVPIDVDCNELLATLQKEDVKRMLENVYKGHIEDEEYNKEFDRQEAMGLEKNSHIRSPEWDDAHEAAAMLPIIFSELPLFE